MTGAEAGLPAAVPSHAEDRALLVAAAEAAGPVAMAHFRRSLRHWEKPGGLGPVTEADLAVNAALRDRLGAARPDYGWLSEEDADGPGRLAAPRLLLVDPIDGTRAFLEGQEGFSIALAVIEAARVVAAAVHLPARGETYAAHRGGGATLGAATIAASAAAEPDGAEALASRSVLDPVHWPGGVPGLLRHFRPSLAWRLCLVAAGRFDATLSFRPTWDWDVAAGSLIAAEAGCRVTDAAGRPFAFGGPDPRQPGFLAAPPALHAALLARRGSAAGGRPA